MLSTSLYKTFPSFNFICCFQRELAKQTFEIITYYSKQLENDGCPGLRIVLCMGGMSVKEQLEVIKKWVFVHILHVKVENMKMNHSTF